MMAGCPALKDLISDGVFLQANQGQWIAKRLQGPLYMSDKFSLKIASWALSKKYIVPDTCDDRTCFWLTDAGRKVLNDDKT